MEKESKMNAPHQQRRERGGREIERDRDEIIDHNGMTCYSEREKMKSGNNVGTDKVRHCEEKIIIDKLFKG